MKKFLDNYKMFYGIFRRLPPISAITIAVLGILSCFVGTVTSLSNELPILAFVFLLLGWIPVLVVASLV